jgi:hypothetical protein
MSDFNSFDPALVEPLRDVVPTSLALHATLNAHGVYSTEQFVLRLSPRVHEMVDAITTGRTEGYDRADLIKAYSTYLHETVHWWQHVGSTTGVILSLAYPTQCLGSMEQLSAVIAKIGPKKPLKRWADEALRGNIPADPATLQTANIAVNNALDVDFYKQFQIWPDRAQALWHNRYFESVGHSYFMAYGNTLNAIVSSCGLAAGSLPDPSGWEARYEALRVAQHEGFYHGSPIRRARVGLHDIMEGQARLAQVQFLEASGGPSEWRSYADQGYFAGIYISAFEEFVRLTQAPRPDQVSDPAVNLFLLICDLALNPFRGFPLEIEYFEDLILDLDPGARFTLLCEAAAARPDVLGAITACSADDYWTTAAILTDACGYDDPRAGLEALQKIATKDPGAVALLAERATFNYDPVNLPLRVVMAEFLAFASDKLRHPEFFCWPGRYAAGAAITPEHQAIFKDHLSLFSDRADTEQVFPRDLPGKDPAGLREMLDVFFGSLILYDMTLQWILRDGPFRYDFKWLTGRSENDALVAWAKRSFAGTFGVEPDAFEILDPTPDETAATG